MCLNPKRRIAEIDNRLQELPKGTLTYKKINGKSQPYVQRTVEGKSVSYYVKLSEREQVFLEFQERTELLEEREHLLAYVESLKKFYHAIRIWMRMSDWDIRTSWILCAGSGFMWIRRILFQNGWRMMHALH